MEFSELLQTRRSIRKYQDKAVSEDLIKEIIKESTLAPSAGNEQPWKYIIVKNKDMIRRISDESKANLIKLIERDPTTYAVKYEAMLRNKEFNVFYNAPCLVIIVGPRAFKNVHEDCSLAASYFMMSATNNGLGTCWVNLGAVIKDPAMLKELRIPDDCKIIAPLALGYPETIPPTPQRKEPEILKVIS